MKRVVAGATGASGTVYATRLVQHLLALSVEVHMVASIAARQVAAFEGFPLPVQNLDPGPGQPGRLVVHRPDDLFAGPASGSFRHGGMVIAPCSMGTIGRLAAGTADSLLLRAADVCLKERRPLVLVVRETPLSRIHLRNLLELTDAGAVVLPAAPSFYSSPASVEDLVDTVLSRVLDHLGIDHEVGARWRETSIGSPLSEHEDGS